MSQFEKQETDLTSKDAGGPETEKRVRMHHDWNNLIEDLIEDGRQRGLFDDLAGKGQPLDLRQNLYEGSMALANQLLKDNDLRPAWLTLRLSVQEKIEQLRSDIARTWQRYENAFQQAVGESHRAALTIGWDDECRRWTSEIGQLNQLVDDYNLRRRSSSLEIFKLRLNDELARVKAPRYLI